VDRNKYKTKTWFGVPQILRPCQRVPKDYNGSDCKGIIPSVFPVNLMLPVPKAQKASQECVGDNQKRTRQINHEKGTHYSLPCRSNLARKSYLRTLTDPSRILPEPA
jgi:hypothetical protein